MRGSDVVDMSSCRLPARPWADESAATEGNRGAYVGDTGYRERVHDAPPRPEKRRRGHVEGARENADCSDLTIVPTWACIARRSRRFEPVRSEQSERLARSYEKPDRENRAQAGRRARLRQSHESPYGDGHPRVMKASPRSTGRRCRQPRSQSQSTSPHEYGSGLFRPAAHGSLTRQAIEPQGRNNREVGTIGVPVILIGHLP